MIKLALADDHNLFAKGLESLIKERSKFDVVGVFSNGSQLIEFLGKQQVDVILTDLNMPVVNGFEILKHCKQHFPQVKVIVLSMYDEEKIFREARDHGADSFLLKDADPDELIYTIQEVFEGRHILNFPGIVQQTDQGVFFDAFRIKYKLSRREMQILKMIGEGVANKDIAQSLNLSVKTIETHRKNIHHKLQVSSLLGLLKKIQELKL
jgi:DNA-binding NarL/FixJ family response regulator